MTQVHTLVPVMGSRAGMLALVLLAGVLVGPVPANAEEKPAMGMLLVASRDLQDPNFERSVILLTSYSEQGAMGLVINRPTTVLPEDVLPEVAGLSHYRGPLFFGGPVEINAILFLVRADETPETGARVFGNVHMSGSRTLLETLSDEPSDTSRLRVYAGYAGWAPGQLDNEILRGGWHLMKATEEIVFADDPETVWQDVVPLPEPVSAGLKGRERQPAQWSGRAAGRSTASLHASSQMTDGPGPGKAGARLITTLQSSAYRAPPDLSAL